MISQQKFVPTLAALLCATTLHAAKPAPAPAFDLVPKVSEALWERLSS